MDELDLELERGTGPDTINEPDEKEDVLTQEEMDQILGFDEEPVFEDEEPEEEQSSLFDRLFGTKEERRKAKEKQKEKKKWQKEAAEKLEADELEFERQEYERLQRDRVDAESIAETERIYEEQGGYEPTREAQMDHVPETVYVSETGMPLPQENQPEIYNEPEAVSPYDALFADQEPEIQHPTAEQLEENHKENENAFVHGGSDNSYVQTASDDHSGLAGYDEPIAQKEIPAEEHTYNMPEDETVQSPPFTSHNGNEIEPVYDDSQEDGWQEVENRLDAGWTEQTEGERDESVAGQVYELGSDNASQHMEEIVMPTSDNTSSPYDTFFVEPEQTVEVPVSEKTLQAVNPESPLEFVHGTESGYVQMDSGNMTGITGDDVKIHMEDYVHVNEPVVYQHRQDQRAGRQENVHIQMDLSGISDPHISQQDHEKITRDAVISETAAQAHNESDYRPSQDRIEYEAGAGYVLEQNVQKAETAESYSIPVKTPFEQLFREEPEVTVLSERQAENASWSPADMSKDYGNNVLPDHEDSMAQAMPATTTSMGAGVDPIATFDQIAQMSRTLNDTVRPTLIFPDKKDIPEYKTPGGFNGSSGKEKKESEVSPEENAKSKENVDKIEKESKDSVFKDLAGTAKNALEMMGSAAIQSVMRSADGDVTYGEGKKNIKKVVRPILQSAAVIGARGVARNLKNDANNAYLAARKVDKLMVKGDLSVADLADKKVLKGKLKDIGINPVTAHNILKNREFVRDSILLKEAFLKMQASKGDVKGSVKTIDRIKSNKTFDFAGKDTATMLKEYFAASNNQKIKNIGRVSDKKLKQMLKNPNKFNLTELDKSAIRVLTKQRKLKNALIKAKQVSSIKRLVVKIGGTIMGKMDDTARAGVENLKKAIMISFGVVKTEYIVYRQRLGWELHWDVCGNGIHLRASWSVKRGNTLLQKLKITQRQSPERWREP